MFKKLIALVLTVFIFTTLMVSFGYAESGIKVTLDGKQLKFDVAPTRINNSTMVPMRTIFEELGFEIKWNGEEKSIIGIKDSKTIKLYIGKNNASVTGAEGQYDVILDEVPTSIDGVTLVPLRFVAESAGITVNWDESSKTVLMASTLAPTKSTSVDYYYFLYNSNRVTNEDLLAMKSYITKFNNANKATIFLKDVVQYSSAPEIYSVLKSESASKSGDLLGIQIFGIEDDVPAFDYFHKGESIPMKSSQKYILEDNPKEELKTDLFYSTFENDAVLFTKDLSIYKIFKEKTGMTLIPEWKVSRLPLTKGEIAGFIEKFYDYENQRTLQGKVTLVNFSSPTFYRTSVDDLKTFNQLDDISYFIQRLDEEFNILKKDDYRLYGNRKGIVTVNSKLTGDLALENIRLENSKAISDFVFNGHGGPNSLLQTITELDVATGIKVATQVPYITLENINDVLSKNYYTTFFKSCKIAYRLNGENMIHEAMVNGKMMNAIAFASSSSNNGMDTGTNIEDMKLNNPAYLYYNFYKSLYQEGKSRSDSLFIAKKIYAEELLRHQDLTYMNNYQFNFMNVFGIHYLGLFEIE